MISNLLPPLTSIGKPEKFQSICWMHSHACMHASTQTITFNLSVEGCTSIQVYFMSMVCKVNRSNWALFLRFGVHHDLKMTQMKTKRVSKCENSGVMYSVHCTLDNVRQMAAHSFDELRVFCVNNMHTWSTPKCVYRFKMPPCRFQFAILRYLLRRINE